MSGEHLGTQNACHQLQCIAKGICERDVYVASAHMPAAESLKYQKLVKKSLKTTKKIYDKKRETKSVYIRPHIGALRHFLLDCHPNW